MRGEKMKREVEITEISDGKFYGINDMVKADCNDCTGCSACCKGMGNSIVLDPLDIYHMCINLECTFEQLLADKIELNMVDGVILPNLKMAGTQETCAFLSQEGRCTIHPFRPGICRIFPLGRFYENGTFQYFLQIHECKKDNRSKVKVKKWIDTPDIKKNQQFIIAWHDFIEEVQRKIQKATDENDIKTRNMYVLQLFYMRPYDTVNSFYEQFEERLSEGKQVV